MREDEVTWYCEQPTASPPEWARVYCGLRPGPTRVMPPSRQDEEGHQSASSYVHCLCWRTCCCTWMCVLAVLLLLIGLVCPHSSSPDFLREDVGRPCRLRIHPSACTQRHCTAVAAGLALDWAAVSDSILPFNGLLSFLRRLLGLG